jgi:hypothetical protein
MGTWNRYIAVELASELHAAAREFPERRSALLSLRFINVPTVTKPAGVTAEG